MDDAYKLPWREKIRAVRAAISFWLRWRRQWGDVRKGKATESEFVQILEIEAERRRAKRGLPHV